MNRITVSEPLLRVGCHLGEGPVYDHDANVLHFVDILEKRVYHLALDTLDYTFEEFEDPVTCLVLRSEGKGLACCTSKGFGFIEGDTITYVCTPLSPQQLQHSRFNDGACDSQGVFFAGTIFSENHGIPGQLFRYDPRTALCTVVDPGPFTDSNGIGWSPDEETMYFTDSKTNIIYAYDYANGEISNRRVHVDGGLLDPAGSADGLAVDAEGCIWSARWGGSKILRYGVDGTRIDFEIQFPTVYKVTSLCFGGPGYDQLYVTTAQTFAVDGDDAPLGQYPDSGHLFCIDLAGRFKGLEQGKFRM